MRPPFARAALVWCPLLAASVLSLACGQPGVPTDGGTGGGGVGGGGGGGGGGGAGGVGGGSGGGASDGGSVATQSAFGVFASLTDLSGEYSAFRAQLGLSPAQYEAWAGQRYGELGARWTRFNLQLVWDFVEPTVGGPFDWTASFGGEAAFAAAARHAVRTLAVFHAGGGGGAGGQAPLRDPLQDLAGWQRFAQAAVERFDGDGVDDAPGGIAIHDWQLGNEIPDWTRAGRTAADYARWVEAAEQAIHRADPSARLVLIASTGAAHLDTFHRDAIAALAARGVRFDALDLHHWGSASLADSRMGAVPEVQAALADAGIAGVELWSMEHGTYVGSPAVALGVCSPACTAAQVCVAVGPGAGLCVARCSSDASCPQARPVCEVASGLCQVAAQTQADQARSLVYRYAINRALGVSVIDWNNLVGWRCFSGACGGQFDLMGLVADGFGPGETPADAGRPRLSSYAYRALSSRTDLGVAEVLAEISTGNAAVHVYPYRHRVTGKRGVVAWAESAQQVSLAWPGAAAQLTGLLSDAAGAPLRSEVLTPAQGEVAVALDPSPVWISEDAAW